jgi:4-hydroxy-tetrahydrodipicolinate synthase
MTHPLAGVFPILHTPLTAADEIDADSMKKQIDWAFELGVDGVCTGMVSEVLRLTDPERQELTRLIVQQTAGRGAVVISVGAESTKGAIRNAQAAEAAGCTALMAIPPVSCALPESELWDYFVTIAESVSLPLIVQDASSYVGKAIPVSFYARLLEKYSPDKILFKPEASPAGPNLSALRDATQGRAKCFDGSGGMLLVDAWKRGLTGTMPGCDLLDGIVLMWRALAEGRNETAFELSAIISAIVALQLQAGLDGFLAIEKYLMVRRGIFVSDRRRHPYSWTMDPETQTYVDELFAALLKAVKRNQHETA